MSEVKEQSVRTENILDKIYSIVLWNDDFNSFEHVIGCLVKYCKHTIEQAQQCSVIVHYKGKCVVKRGDKESLIQVWNNLTAENLTATLEI